MASRIPSEFTCDEADVSPELDIVGIPASAQSLAIVVGDPDAPLGTWVRWVEFNFTSQTATLEVSEGSEPIGDQGVNSWHIAGYMGPCPPEDEEHEYKFTVYALDTTLELTQRIEAGRLYAAMGGHVIASTVLTGTYGR